MRLTCIPEVRKGGNWGEIGRKPRLSPDVGFSRNCKLRGSDPAQHRLRAAQQILNQAGGSAKLPSW
jgi:hypothetical protein